MPENDKKYNSQYNFEGSYLTVDLQIEEFLPAVDILIITENYFVVKLLLLYKTAQRIITVRTIVKHIHKGRYLYLQAFALSERRQPQCNTNYQYGAA